jgi:hypothetical protein
MLFRGTIAVYCENHTEHINELCEQNGVYINSVPTSQETHHVSATNTNRLMLLIVVYCENHTEHINTLCGQNIELLCVKKGGIYTYPRAKLSAGLKRPLPL